MRSKLFAITALTPSSCVPLAAQSRERAGAVLLAAEDDGRRALRDVAHRRVVDEHLLARRLEQRDAAFLARAVGTRRQHQVLDAHVGERAAHHHLVVAAARAVAVEIGLHHAVLDQPLAGGRVLLDRAGGRDVVGGDRIAEDAERARAADVAVRRRASSRSRRRTAAWRCRSTSASCRPGPASPAILPHIGLALASCRRAGDRPRDRAHTATPRRSRATSARCP